MKRIFLFLLLISVLSLAGCEQPQQDTTNTSLENNDKTNSKTNIPATTQATASEDNDIFEIREKMFISQCNDIYLNPKDYVGRKVKIEGFCDIQIDPQTGKSYYGVLRNGPGCCGNDGIAGFEFTYDGQYPKQNDWLEVIGKIVITKINDEDTVIIHASEVTVKDTRGADFVAN